MILLIKKDCSFCDEIKEMSKKFPEIKIFYVQDNMVEMEDQKFPLDERIPALPALIHESTVYVGKEYIKEFLEKLNKDV